MSNASSYVAIAVFDDRVEIHSIGDFPTGIRAELLTQACGTSLLTNGASADDRAWLTKVANDVEVDGTRRALRNSRSFRKLQGDPVPGSTHELYAWSDGATGRLFGHYDAAGVFVFDRLTNHLP